MVHSNGWSTPQSIDKTYYLEKSDSDALMFGVTTWEVYYDMQPCPKDNNINTAVQVASKESLDHLWMILHQENLVN